MGIPFKRVLIANRGEIAVRIASSLRQLQLSPIAIYSAADRLAPHVTACDAAYNVGAAEVNASYLNIAAILAAAAQAQADAIHPGYGFLAENAAFAQAVSAAGYTFIGPSAHAIACMGNKTQARALMQAAGVPVIPGNTTAFAAGAAGAAAAAKLAAQIGYPVMLKAAKGGGGKGMRLVHSAAALAAALRATMSEAHSAFGDGAVYMEKALLQPRHIEVQIFAASPTEVYVLGERECSMQRRHQKVIEESPAPGLTAALRQRLGEVAVAAAQAVDYVGAGTVEFLLDAAQNFYFLEMNTRLQVEHAVTEACWGVDLVAAQVQVAQAQPLAWSAQSLQSRGHAIEARLYAEDAQRNFLPCPGRITQLSWPHIPGLRIDSGVRAGFDVPSFYDPMVAKLIYWGEDREQARRGLVLALQQTHLQGIVTNRTFLIDVLQSAEFMAGRYHTGSLQQGLRLPAPPPSRAAQMDQTALLAAAVIARYERDQRLRAQPAPTAGSNQHQAWRQATWLSRAASPTAFGER